MNNYFLSEFLSSRIYSIRETLKEYQCSKGERQIHEVRVNIKKVRSVYFFLSEVYGERRYPRKVLKNLFKNAGRVRELQVNIRMLKKYNRNSALYDTLKKEERDLSEKFARRIPHFIESLQKFEKKFKLPAHLPTERRFKQYFDEQIHKSEILLYQTHDKNNMHQFRKSIKSLMYLYNALPRGKLKKGIDMEQKKINKVQDEAGNWHDTYAAVKFFEKIKDEAPDVIKTLSQKEKSQFQSLLHHSRSLFIGKKSQILSGLLIIS